MADGDFLNRDEEARLVALVADLERKTSGEIRIHITKSVSSKGVMSDAAEAFIALGMTKTEARNGVLLFIAVKDKELACIGDKGIHEKIGDDGWKLLVDNLRASFAKGDYYVGVHAALTSIGETLKLHFPGNGGENELPDEISRS